MALQNGPNDSVKKFARQMVTGHTEANSELKAIASRKYFAAPARLDPECQSTVQEWRSRGGSNFEATFTCQMTTAQDKAIALFTATQSISDPDIAASMPSASQTANHQE